MTRPPRIRRLRAVALASVGAGVLLACGSSGGSDDGTLPDTVTIVVPNAPGGLADNAVRPLQRPLQDELGVNVVVENTTGAGGLIAANNVYTATADGSTLLAVVQPSSVLSSLYESQSPEFREFEFLGRLTGDDSMAVAVREDSEIETIEDLENADDGLKVSTISGLNNQALAEAIFTDNTGVSFVRVPYEGGSESVQAVIDGVTDVTFASLSALAAPVEAGQLRMLGYFSDEPIERYSDFPLFSESHPGAGFTVGVGLVAPPETPEATLEALRSAIDVAATSDAYADGSAQNAVPSYLDAVEWAAEFDSLFELAEGYGDALTEVGARTDG